MLILELVALDSRAEEYSPVVRAELRGRQLVTVWGDRDLLTRLGIPDLPVEDLDSADRSAKISFQVDPDRYVRMLPRRYAGTYMQARVTEVGDMPLTSPQTGD